MTGTATARWKPPSKRASGLPMKPAHFKGTEVALAAVGGPYAVLTDPILPPDKLEHVMPDLTPGDYKCRLVALDLEDDRGKPPVELLFTIEDDSPPGPVEDATITVT